MFGHNNWKRSRIRRVVIYAIITTTIFLITAAGSDAAVFSFMDPVKQFLGLQPVQVIVLPERSQPGEASIRDLADAVMANTPPTVSTNGAVLSYTFGSGAQFIVSDGTVTDPDSSNFNNGSLVAQITTNGDSALDALSIGNRGNITVTGNNIKYTNQTVATYAIESLTITVIFNSNSTPTKADAVLEAIQFVNNTGGSTATRTVTFTVNDGDGGQGADIAAIVFVLPTPTNTATNTPTPVTYSVIYNGNGNTGGSGPADPNSPYVPGATVGVLGPGTLVKTDYQFGGWNTASDGSGTRYTPAQAFIINVNTTLYAQWIVPPCFTSGGLDPTFDGDGKVTTGILSSSDIARSVAIQADGRIVTAGYAFNGSYTEFALARYNPDGSLDATFDGDGKVTTDITSSDNGAFAVAIQPDGKIVAAGTAFYGSSYDFALVRYNPDGSLDATFDGDGKVTTDISSLNDVAYSVSVQPDGKIVAAGLARNGSSYVFALVRYNPDGSLDTTFDGDGKVTTSIPSLNGQANSVAIQPDGKIVAAGYVWSGALYYFALVRYNADGSLDSSFGGMVTTLIFSGDNRANSVAIQADGKIVAAGYAGGYFALARYEPNGDLDTTFDGDGKVTTDILSSWSAQAHSVAIQPDGKIVAAGETNDGYYSNFALARYNPDGSLDTTFDGDGKVTTVVLTSTDSAYSVATLPDGKIVAAGVTANGPDADFALVRYGVSCPLSTPTATATDTATATATATFTPTPTVPPAITGTVTYGNVAAPVKYVSNVLIRGAGDINVIATTSFPGGTYSLTGFGTEPYLVSPIKTGGVNGISSFDAAKIAAHVAGISLLTGNQLIVADVSGNGSVSSFDAGQIAQFVVSSSGMHTGEWSFVPTYRSYPPITGDITNQDYTALLMGEISGNWTNTGARPENCEGPAASEGDRSNIDCAALTDMRASTAGGIRVTAPQLVIWADNEVVVPLIVDGAADKGIISYEFDLRYDPTVIQPQEDPVDLAGTVSRGLIAVANAKEPGRLRVAVYGPRPIDRNGLFLNLRFTAVGKAGSVSPLTFERIMFNEGESRVVVTNGEVELF